MRITLDPIQHIKEVSRKRFGLPTGHIHKAKRSHEPSEDEQTADPHIALIGDDGIIKTWLVDVEICKLRWPDLTLPVSAGDHKAVPIGERWVADER